MSTPLTLIEMSDRELLLVLRDVSDGAGFATAIEVAAKLGLDESRAVACRLSWLKRYGAVDREFERDEAGNIRYHRNGKVMHSQRWCLTKVGMTMATGKLRKSQQQALENLDDGASLMAMRWFTGRVASSDPTVSKLLDREYRHGLHRR